MYLLCNWKQQIKLKIFSTLFTGHRRRTTTTSSTQTTIIYTTIENDDETTESSSMMTLYLTTEAIHPKLPKPLRLSSPVLENDYEDVHNIDNIIEAEVNELIKERHKSKHREVLKGLDEVSLTKNINKVKKMYRDSSASAINKLSAKGVKSGIFLTENCTTVVAQIGTTAILHCEVSDITENTVSVILLLFIASQKSLTLP